MFCREDETLPPVPSVLEPLVRDRVVVLDGCEPAFTQEQEEALCAFVEQGAGLICLGAAVQRYRESANLCEVLGPLHGFLTPRTELIASHTDNEHYLTRRAENAFPIVESVYLLDAVPPDADIHLHTSWHYTPHTLAYTRRYGRGRVFCTVLGTTPPTRAHPAVQQLLTRAIRYVKYQDRPERPLQVAMLGYGAIGLEHGAAVSAVAGLEYALVCDRNEERLAQAQQDFPGIQVCLDASQVARDDRIDLVIISTPPNTHASLAMQMLRAGKHVVVEKPFCLATAEADAMIALAQAQQRLLTVYQCRRWDPDYLAIQRIVEQGTVGTIFHLETFIGGYAHPCSYWHSHEPISGGVFYDWGSHYLDWILQLIPDRVVSVQGNEHKRVWHDVTNADQSSVRIRFAQGQEAEFLHSDIAAVLKPKWYILGEQGAIVGQWRQETVKTRRWSGDLVEARLAPSEALPDLSVITRTSDGLLHEQRVTLPPAPLYPFHTNLANHLHAGEALAVPAQEARRNIAVMEAARRSVLGGGQIVALDC
ncbi:MAG TPA: Gfo/Idh/MocA family oxidoreductase [Ktedonobacteraceae bacterium]|jgi:predicted dehydrogenase